MKTELTYVTPAMARKMLERNTRNRDVRPHHVADLMAIWMRGEWKPTHQGIAIGKSGDVLDGQHRLLFIAELPEGTKVPLNLTTDADDDTFDVIDVGLKRTTSDTYHVTAGLVAVARFLAKIHNSGNSAGLSNQFVKPFIDWVQPEYEELLTFAPGVARVWGSAPFRASAIVQMKRGYDADFIKVAYHSLVHSDVDTMPYAARALMSQHMSGKIGSARSPDLFCRGLRVFDSSNNRKVKSLLIKDASVTIDEVRQWIAAQMKKAQSMSPGRVVAKPAANFNWRKAA